MGRIYFYPLSSKNAGARLVHRVSMRKSRFMFGVGSDAQNTIDTESYGHYPFFTSYHCDIIVYGQYIGLGGYILYKSVLEDDFPGFICKFGKDIFLLVCWAKFSPFLFSGTMLI